MHTWHDTHSNIAFTLTRATHCHAFTNATFYFIWCTRLSITRNEYCDDNVREELSFLSTQTRTESVGSHPRPMPITQQLCMAAMAMYFLINNSQRIEYMSKTCTRSCVVSKYVEGKSWSNPSTYADTHTTFWPWAVEKLSTPEVGFQGVPNQLRSLSSNTMTRWQTAWQEIERVSIYGCVHKVSQVAYSDTHKKHNETQNRKKNLWISTWEGESWKMACPLPDNSGVPQHKVVQGQESAWSNRAMFWCWETCFRCRLQERVPADRETHIKSLSQWLWTSFWLEESKKSNQPCKIMRHPKPILVLSRSMQNPNTQNKAKVPTPNQSRPFP